MMTIMMRMWSLNMKTVIMRMVIGWSEGERVNRSRKRGTDRYVVHCCLLLLLVLPVMSKTAMS